MTPAQAQQLLADLRVVRSRISIDLSELPVRWEVADADLRAFADGMGAPVIDPGTGVTSLWGLPVRVDENAASWSIVSQPVPSTYSETGGQLTVRLCRRVAWHVLEHGAKASVEFLYEPAPQQPGPPWKHSPAGVMSKLIAAAQGETDAGPPADLSQIVADLQALPQLQPSPEPKKYLAPALDQLSKQMVSLLAVPEHLLAEDEAPPTTHAEAVERAAIAKALRDIAEFVLTNGLKTDAIESLKATKDHVYRLNLTVTKETPPWKL